MAHGADCGVGVPHRQWELKVDSTVPGLAGNVEALLVADKL